jgi:hypothetical protein
VIKDFEVNIITIGLEHSSFLFPLEIKPVLFIFRPVHSKLEPGSDRGYAHFRRNIALAIYAYKIKKFGARLLKQDRELNVQQHHAGKLAKTIKYTFDVFDEITKPHHIDIHYFDHTEYHLGFF